MTELLWLTRYSPYPPLRGGDTQYSRELVHSLARRVTTRGLAFEAAGVETPADAPIAWHTVPYHRRSRLAGLFGALPNVASRFAQPHYFEAAIDQARRVDGVFVDFIGMAWLVAPLRRALGPGGPPIVMVTHNHEAAMRREIARDSRWPKRIVLARDAEKAAQLEQRANVAADGITAITPEDAADFATQTSVPVQVMLPGYAGPYRTERTLSDATPSVACIIGNRASTHKVTVLDHALAALSAAGVTRQVRIEVAGAGDLAAVAGRYTDVRTLGFVEDMAAYADRVRVGLIPDDLGGGFKMRALTLGALRVPIVGLHTAMRGTGFVPGEHYLGFDTLPELAAALPALMEDFPRLNAVQDAAFAHVTARYRWEDRGAELLAFVTALHDRKARAA